MKWPTIAIAMISLTPFGLSAQQDADAAAVEAGGARDDDVSGDTVVPTLSDLAEPDAPARAPTEDIQDPVPDAVSSTGTVQGTDSAVPGDAGTSSPPVPSPEAKVSGDTDADDSAPPGASYGTRDKLVLYSIPERFEGPKKYTLAILGGLTRFDELDGIMASSNGVQDYFSWAPSFRLQMGRQFADQLQIQLEIGFERYRGFALAEDGAVSGDVIEAKAYPGSLSLSYRFDYLDEQAVVPYLSAGLTAVAGTFTDFEETLAAETSSDTSTEDTTTSDTTTDSTGTTTDSTAVTLGAVGTRAGAYLGVGLEFLLDVFEPERASDLELSSGINDSYLVLDVRYYWLDRYFEDATLKRDQDNVPYNGLQITAGLKFDF